jgi:hypothetical protein
VTRGSLVFLCALLGAGTALGQQPAAEPAEPFAYERPVTASAGPQRLPVDGPLLAAGQAFHVTRVGTSLIAAGGLGDLRLFETNGSPVPYILVQPSGQERWVTGRLVPIPTTKTTSGFEADAGSVQPLDAIRVEGIPAPFLKRLTLEASGDRARWISLATEATLFDLPAEQLRQLEIAFPPGSYRYLRLVWNDTNSGRVPLPRSVIARSAGRVAPPIQPSIDVSLERQASEPGRSRYRVRLPAGRLPIVALELEVAGGHVLREAIVSESRFAGLEAAPTELGRATLRRVVRDGVPASDLRIPIAPPVESELQLTIEDGSNPPLEVQRVRLHFAQLPWIYFESPSKEIVARYGARLLRGPQFDLEAVRESIDITRVPDARWGEPRALVETAAAAAPMQGLKPGAQLEPASFRHSRGIRGGAAGL